MSLVTAAPETTPRDLHIIGSIIGSANTAVVGPTPGVMAVAAGDLDTAIARLLGKHVRTAQQRNPAGDVLSGSICAPVSGGTSAQPSPEVTNEEPARDWGVE